jgi:hypothetical protein
MQPPAIQKGKPVERDAILRLSVQRLNDGTYAVLATRRKAGQVSEEQIGRAVESHLIASERFTDALLVHGADMERAK